MNINGFDLEPRCVLFISSLEELGPYFAELIQEKTGVLPLLRLSFDSTNQYAIQVQIDPYRVLDPEEYLKVQMQYPIQYPVLIGLQLICELFDEETGNDLHAHGIEDDDRLVYIEIPPDVYDAWRDASTIMEDCPIDIADPNNDEEVEFQ